MEQRKQPVTYANFVIIIIIFKTESAVLGFERVRTLSIQLKPQPHTTKTWKKEKLKIVGNKKRMNRLGQQEGIGSAFKTGQSHTIKHRVIKIVL